MPKLSSYFLLLLLLTGLNIHAQKAQQNVTRNEKTVITGKIENYDPRVPLTVTIHRLGARSITMNPKMEGDGSFYVEPEVYMPTEAWVGYQSNFRIVLHPGDSLHVIFDGAARQRSELLSTVRVDGSDAATNRGVLQFQQLYENSDLVDRNKATFAVKNYNPTEYLAYNDTIRKKGRELYNTFIKQYAPNEKSRRWALFESEAKYYDNILYYAMDHLDANDKSPMFDTTLVLPERFYDRLTERLPLEKDNMLNTTALSTFADQFILYVNEQLKSLQSPDEVWGILPGGGLFAALELVDSLVLTGITRFVSDPLLKEIMLAGEFSRRFGRQDVSAYERFDDLRAAHLSLPFLTEPLHRHYLETKWRNDNPVPHSESILRELPSGSVEEIFSDILTNNEGKVIYIDFWATWCGPCLGEFPNSRQLENELKDREVSFVYICVNSAQEKYKPILSQYQLAGQHYFLSRIQSQELLQHFAVQGIPYYVLIDKEGVIRERGSHLRPRVAKAKIEAML